MNRMEKDSLGEQPVPADACWGIHTQRALDNFPSTGQRVHPALIRALALVKKACCLANLELGYLPEEKAKAILLACDEILAGTLADQFPLDALQGGAGTSTNMNVNEVIANRAIEILGGAKGQYGLVDPLEDVNLHQSTNDVYPTAVKIAAIMELRALCQSIASLQGAFQRKEKEFAAIPAIGRTELQEAVPLSLGAQFGAFAEAVARDRWRTFKCEERLRVVNIGGTAVGTGLGAPRRYIFLVIEKLREVTGLGLARAENPVDQTANADAFVEVAGILSAHASTLIKIACDLRLLNLLGEVRLPAVQVGSSIMPGKVNPVICEYVIQCSLLCLGYVRLVEEATSRSTLQICEFLPLVSHALLSCLSVLRQTDETFCRHLAQVAADPDACRRNLTGSPTLVTAFLPLIGYRRAAELLAEFATSGRTDMAAFLAEKLGAEVVARTLSAHNLMSLGYRDEDDA